MTARTTGRQPGPGRPPGPRGTAKRPARRPTADLTATGPTTSSDTTDTTDPISTTAITQEAGEVDDLTAVGTAAETADDAPADSGSEVDGAGAADDEAPDAPEACVAAPEDVAPVASDDVVETVETVETVEVVEVVEAPADEEAGTAARADETPEPAVVPDDTDVVIDLTAVEDGPRPEASGVPPIDANVLLRAILTPPTGIDSGNGLTDALTGAVPTWRLDEEPIYLEVIRDLGVPAVPEADGGTGEVIVGEVLVADGGS